jgi:small subunit ribosomal protein S6
MTLPAPTYDLVLLLDPQTEGAVRAKIVGDAHEAIAAKGQLVNHDEWGERALAYPIDHKTTAEYHLLQFHPTTVELIAELNRTLHITDGVIRFRINKLKPGTPAAPDMHPGASPPAREEIEQAPAEEQAVA